jgi:hypothetical protein
VIVLLSDGENNENPDPILAADLAADLGLARFGGLSGVSAEVNASAGRQAFREKMLFTHRGLSGPAILQISSYWEPGKELLLDLLPEMEHGAL